MLKKPAAMVWGKLSKGQTPTSKLPPTNSLLIQSQIDNDMYTQVNVYYAEYDQEYDNWYSLKNGAKAGDIVDSGFQNKTYTTNAHGLYSLSSNLEEKITYPMLSFV